MALRFAAAQSIEVAFDPECERRIRGASQRGEVIDFECMPKFEHVPYDGYAVFAVGAGEVGRFRRIRRMQSAVAPTAAGEVAVRVRIRTPEAVRIASNALFCPEGQAERYQPARYGELRVGEDGVALLTGMRDEARQSL